MKRNELLMKLRLDFNNYIRDNYLKDKCEKCGLEYVIFDNYKQMTEENAKLREFRQIYHTWPSESGKHNYEIDFLLSRGSTLLVSAF